MRVMKRLKNGDIVHSQENLFYELGLHTKQDLSFENWYQGTYEYDFLWNFEPNNQFWRDAIKKSLPKEERTQPDVEQKIDQTFANFNRNMGNIHNPNTDIMDACFSVLHFQSYLLDCYYDNDDRYNNKDLAEIMNKLFQSIDENNTKEFQQTLFELEACCNWFKDNPLYPVLFLKIVKSIEEKIASKDTLFQDSLNQFSVNYPNINVKML